MKRKLNLLLTLMLTVGLVLTMTACSKNNRETAPDGEALDSETIKEKGNLVVGITYFEPMDFQDDDGNWIGFDAELAEMFVKELGVEAEFQEINWATKEVELQAGTIDAIWNGLTWSEERAEQMGMTEAYLGNEQILVVPKGTGAEYNSIEDLAGKNIAVESGSAGQDYLNTELVDSVAVEKEIQLDALTECVAGTVDGAIVDEIMARYLINKEGSNFSDLEIVEDVLQPERETYSVAFRQGSDMIDMANEFFETIKADGRLEDLAVKYNLDGALLD